MTSLNERLEYERELDTYELENIITLDEKCECEREPFNHNFFKSAFDGYGIIL
jgi:hypothetical protein